MSPALQPPNVILFEGRDYYLACVIPGGNHLYCTPGVSPLDWLFLPDRRYLSGLTDRPCAMRVVPVHPGPKSPRPCLLPIQPDRTSPSSSSPSSPPSSPSSP